MCLFGVGHHWIKNKEFESYSGYTHSENSAEFILLEVDVKEWKCIDCGDIRQHVSDERLSDKSIPYNKIKGIKQI